MLRKTMLLVLVLVAVALFETGTAAQQQLVRRSPLDLVAPVVVAGPEVGFRIAYFDANNVPVGQLVIKVNGVWVAPETAK